MFGIFRYCLALMVVLAHLWPSLTNWTGIYGVFGFYIMSGYLMTFVLTNVYVYSLDGLKRFFINRILRIYPLYIIFLLLSVVVIYFLPEISRQINPRMLLPTTLVDWVRNFVIFNLTFENKTRLVPPAWSLNVELFFYIVMALILARKQSLVYIWFFSSLMYTLYLIYFDATFNDRYFPIFAASLPFSMGSSLYFIYPKIKQFFKVKSSFFIALFITILLNLFHIIFAPLIWPDERFEGLYATLFINAILIIFLINLKEFNIPVIVKKIDKFLGNLAYPLFLCHWQVSVLVTFFIFSGNIQKNLSLFLYSLVISHIIIIPIYYYIDKNINKTRDKIRRTQNSPGSSIPTVNSVNH